MIGHAAMVENGGDDLIPAAVPGEDYRSHRRIFVFETGALFQRFNEFANESFEPVRVLELSTKGIRRITRSLRHDQDGIAARFHELPDQVVMLKDAFNMVLPAMEMNDQVEGRSFNESLGNKNRDRGIGVVGCG